MDYGLWIMDYHIYIIDLVGGLEHEFDFSI